MKQIKGGITAAKGFSAAAVTAGIKDSKKPDCGLIVSDRPCSAAGAFTTNAVRASSVDWCEGALPGNGVRAVFCNSGNANACTGDRGMRDTQRIAADVAALLGAKERVRAGRVDRRYRARTAHGKNHQKPARSVQEGRDCAGSRRFRICHAIMTTDTKKKECSFSVKTSAGTFIVGGCAKGSGMICPNMATMLAFITTDVRIPSQKLSAIVKSVVDRTFNNLTVDGDTSTNDMVLVLANGASGVSVATKGPDAAAFEHALYEVCDTLCRKIAEDGEGATKRVEVRVCGGESFIGAKKAARAIANSNLVKTAIFGNDPNWGRILCAIGYSGARFSKEKLQLRLCGTPVFKRMRPAPFDAAKLSARMKGAVVRIDADLGLGNHCAVAHTCDLTYNYIRINAEYHT